MLKHIQSLGLALLLSVGEGSVGHAASFDCSKATTETEIAICNDRELSALDEALHIAYRDIFASNFDNAARVAKIEQRDWITERNLCGSKVFCLIEKYKIRHIELSNAIYDKRHQPFTGSFLPLTMNGSLVSVLNKGLEDWDLLAIDSIVGASDSGMSIATALIVRKKVPLRGPSSRWVQSDATFFALINGSLDKKFSDTAINFYPVGDLVQNFMQDFEGEYNTVKLNILSSNRVELVGQWLRGNRTMKLSYSPDEGLSVNSESMVRVVYYTIFSSYLNYDHNVMVDSYGYIFSKDELQTLPRFIGKRIESRKCNKKFYKKCNDRELYNLGVKLYSNPDSIDDALVIFELLSKRDFVLGESAYEKVFRTIETLQTLDRFLLQ